MHDKTEKMRERLDEVGADIEEAKRKERELEPHTDGQPFYDPEDPKDGDQTIVAPG